MNMNQKANSAPLINGLFAVIVAIISIVGTYLLKDPIQKIISSPHCKVGGVWKPHGDLLQHCNINQVKNKFYIDLQVSFTNNNSWIISGEGTIEGEEGQFTGDIIYLHEDILGNTPSTRSSNKITGVISLQGCDGLGVTLIDPQTSTQLKTFAFIRESLDMKAIPKDQNN